MEKTYFYAGTLANPTENPSIAPSVGIYRFEMNSQTGELLNCGLAAKANGPSWVTKHPFLPEIWYAVASSDDGTPGEDVLFALHQEADGTLTRINTYASGGISACHASVFPNGKFIGVANYRTGTVAFFELNSDGSIRERNTLVQLEGKGPNPVRQAKSYAHFIHADQTGKYVLVCNLGADRIHSYCFDETENYWKPNPEFPYTQSASGSGPRHLVFSPEGRYVYVINELSCTLDAFAYDSETGALTLVTSVPTLPPQFLGLNKGAAIDISKDGKFLYVTNRGANLITVFAVNSTPVDGSKMEAGVLLNPIQYIPSGGEFPRFAGLNPHGDFFLAANKKSHNITVFHAHPTTGFLTQVSSVPIAWCTGITWEPSL